MLPPSRFAFALAAGARAAEAVRKQAETLHARLTLPGQRVVKEPYLELVALAPGIGHEQIHEAIQAAAHLKTEVFEFALDQANCFVERPSEWWIGPRGVPVPLRQLRDGLMAGLQARGVPHDRSRYVPHVTVLEDAPRPLAPMRIAPLAWHANRLVLLRDDRAGAAPVRLSEWWLGHDGDAAEGAQTRLW
jgi:RNA 2',3'-cyclic 3'-phosphodiesterase